MVSGPLHTNTQAPEASAVEDVDAPLGIPLDVAPVETVRLDTSSLGAQARQGGSVTLEVLGRPLSLDLTVHDMRAPDHRAYLRTEDGVVEVDTGFLGTYLARDVEAPALVGRATVTDRFFDLWLPREDGTLLTLQQLPADDGGPSFDVRLIEAPELSVPAASPADFLGLGDEQSFLPYLEDTAVGVLGPSIVVPGGGGDAVVVDAIVDADYEFYAYDPELVWQRQATVMSLAEQIWIDDLSTAWNLKEQWAWTRSGKPTTETDCGELRDDVRAHWRSYHKNTGRDFVVFLANRDLESDTSGTANAGCATRGGVTGSYSYAMVEAGTGTPYDNDKQRWIIAHEVGHLFQGHHDAAQTSSSGKSVMSATIPSSSQRWENYSDFSGFSGNENRILHCLANRGSSCSGMADP